MSHEGLTDSPSCGSQAPEHHAFLKQGRQDPNLEQFSLCGSTGNYWLHPNDRKLQIQARCGEFLGPVQSQSSLAHPSPAAEQWLERGSVALIILLYKTWSNQTRDVCFFLFFLLIWFKKNNGKSCKIAASGFGRIENRLLCSYPYVDKILQNIPNPGMSHGGSFF